MFTYRIALPETRSPHYSYYAFVSKPLISSSRACLLFNKIMLDVELSGTDDAFFDHTKGLYTGIMNLHFNLFWQNVFSSVISFHYL